MIQSSQALGNFQCWMIRDDSGFNEVTSGSICGWGLVASLIIRGANPTFSSPQNPGRGERLESERNCQRDGDLISSASRWASMKALKGGARVLWLVLGIWGPVSTPSLHSFQLPDSESSLQQIGDLVRKFWVMWAALAKELKLRRGSWQTVSWPERQQTPGSDPLELRGSLSLGNLNGPLQGVTERACTLCCSPSFRIFYLDLMEN